MSSEENTSRLGSPPTSAILCAFAVAIRADMGSHTLDTSPVLRILRENVDLFCGEGTNLTPEEVHYLQLMHGEFLFYLDHPLLFLMLAPRPSDQPLM